MTVPGSLLQTTIRKTRGYTISQSIRFNDDDSAYMTKTFGGAGDGTGDTCTYSVWLKRGNLGNSQYFLSADAVDPYFLGFQADNTLRFTRASGGSPSIITTAVFRDVSAWYHIVLTIDTSLTAANRWKLYVNGVRQTVTTGGTPGSTNLGDAVAHYIGRYTAAASYFDGYMAEIHFIDGTALDASSFGEVDSDTGQWVPIKYTGSYGTNGFYITGEDSADLGADYSGNSNDFTSSGLTSADQVLDSPSDNQSTYNPIAGATLSSPAYSEGNTRVVNSSETGSDNYRGTIGVSSGKWYVEFLITTVGGGENAVVGVVDSETPVKNPAGAGNTPLGFSADSYAIIPDGRKVNNNSASAYGSSFTDGDVIGIALDMDNGAIWFSKNNTWQASATQSEIEAGTTTNAAFTGLTGTKHFASAFSAGVARSADVTMRPEADWTGTCPSGFKALRTANLPTPAIALPEKYFNTVLYEGNGGGQRVGQFQPITETYTVPNSVIFNDDDSAYLSRTPGSAGNRKTWTFSSWVKRANLFNGSVPQIIFSAANGSTLDFVMQFGQTDDTLRISDYFSGSASNLITTQQFRDSSAWYHFVLQYDTTQATSSDRMKLYVNGAQVTAFGTESYPSLNYDSAVNNNLAHNISRGAYSANGYFDGYLAEIYFIDGQALGPDSFGQLDTSTNRWIPKDASGLTFGTNGFYLDMETAPGTGSGAGTDSSGNGNNFTESGLAAADQVLDSPTNNQSVLDANRIDAYTLSQGNLFTNAVGDAAAIGTIAFDPQDEEGFYFEAKVTTAATYPNVGIRTLADIPTGSGMSGNTTGRYAYTGSNGQFNAEGTGISYGDVWAGTANKVIGVYIKAGELFFSVDGTIQNSGTPAITGLTGLMVPTVFYDAGSGTHASWEMRFNSSDWSTTPSGYKSISTDNLPLSNGELSTFVWIKNRDALDNHMLFDAVRGATKDLHSNVVNAEVTNPNTLTRFLKNGFEVGNDVEVNTSGESYVAWQWLNDSLTTSSNTDGSITSTVLANTTSGFSIVGYVGNSTSGATVGHGLGAVPKMMILKDRDVGENWVIYHEELGPTKFMYFTADAAFTVSNRWNDTAPTSSVFTLGNETQVNATGRDYVVYCFAEVEGFNKIGSYTGNGSTDGPFVYTGFKPAFLFIKSSSLSTSWYLFDDKRDPTNPSGKRLVSDGTYVEDDGTTEAFDFLSNGFKLRNTSAGTNGSGSTYIFMAFAESPFKTATAR